MSKKWRYRKGAAFPAEPEVVSNRADWNLDKLGLCPPCPSPQEVAALRERRYSKLYHYPHSELLDILMCVA